MSDYAHHQSSHKSIIKQEIYPDELDCISDDECDRQMSSLCIDTSKQTIITQFQHDSITIDTCPNNNTSLEDIDQNLDLLSPQFSRTSHQNQQFNRGVFRFPSPSPCRKANEQEYISTALRRSCSHEHLSHSTLQEKLTADSGTGDSVEHYPLTTCAQPLHYEVVPIYGQDGVVALMANRYEFDQEKIDEYLRHKRRNFLKSIFFKPPSPSSMETTLKPIETNKNLIKSPTKKSGRILQRFRKSHKHPSIDESYSEPIVLVRHHSSQLGTNENH